MPYKRLLLLLSWINYAGNSFSFVFYSTNSLYSYILFVLNDKIIEIINFIENHGKLLSNTQLHEYKIQSYNIQIHAVVYKRK